MRTASAAVSGRDAQPTCALSPLERGDATRDLQGRLDGSHERELHIARNGGMIVISTGAVSALLKKAPRRSSGRFHTVSEDRGGHRGGIDDAASASAAFNDV